MPDAVTDLRITQIRQFADGPCASCGRELKQHASVFLDLLGGRTHCDGCGKALRYHRKKAWQRGEEIPRTIAEVDARLGL